MKLLPGLLTICLFFINLSSPVFANHFIAGDASDDPNHPIINELMPDPTKVTDANGEWLELKNATTSAINLKDWKIEDLLASHIINQNLTVLPGRLVILCRENDVALNGGVNCDYEWAGLVSLNNSGSETIRLRNPLGTIVDAVSYGSSNVVAGKSITITENSLRTLSQETVTSYGLGDFGTPANNRIQIGNKLYATFSDALNVATASASLSVPSDFTVTTAENNGTEISIPAGTVIASGGTVFSINDLISQTISVGSLSGFNNHTIADAALQWGVPNLALTFDQPITVGIFAGTSLNGQTLSVTRSTSGSGSWTSDGIVAPATCTISSGVCSFQVTKASFYAVTHTSASAAAASTATATQDTTTPSGPFAAPACSDQKPDSAPTLLSATSTTNSVTLNWSKATNPVSYYLITYGLGPTLQQYGNPNVGGPDTTSYTIQGLSGGTTYYFKVRAGNGCAPGDFSNELAATPIGGVVSEPATGFAPGVLGAKTKVQPEQVTSTPQIQQPPPQPQGKLLSAILGFFSNIFGLIKNLFGT